MPIYKIKAGQIPTVEADTYVGQIGTIFFDNTGVLRISNGVTPGGVFITSGTGGTGGNGYTGSQGTAGYNGSAGYTGSAGIVGYNGSVGFTGSQGTAGYNGSVGYTGSAGYNGSVGYTGSKGDIGYTGSVGPSNIINATEATTGIMYPVMVPATGSNQTAYGDPGLYYDTNANALYISGEIIASKLTIELTTVTTTLVTTDDIIRTTNTTASTSTNTGALQVAGGVGIGGSVYVGGAVTATTSVTVAGTGGDLTMTGGAITGVGNITASGTVAINASGGITTTQTSFDIVNSIATTVNIGGAATAVNIGSSAAGTLTINNPTIVGSSSTQVVFDTIATTVNAFRAATALTVGATSGILTLRNPTIVGTQASLTLFNTVATTVNAFGAATTLSVGAATGLTTIRNSLVVNSGTTVNGNTTINSAGASAFGTGAQLYIDGTNYSRIDFSQNFDDPVVGSRSTGTRILFVPGTGLGKLDTGIGMSTNTLWTSVQDPNYNVGWYAGDLAFGSTPVNLMTLTGSGNLTVKGSVSSTGFYVNNKQAVNGPAFRAYIDIGQAITSGSQQKVTFGTETFDTNSNFSSSRFTPTIEGYYQLNATVRIAGTSGTGEIMITIWKNGSEYARGTNEGGTEQGNNFYSLQVSDLVYANGTGDYFEIYIQQSSGGNRDTTAGSNISYFSGSMVRGA